MKSKQLLILSLSVILISSFLSCEKSNEKRIEKKIEGTWIKAKVEDPDSNEFDTWRFDNGYIYVVRYKTTGSHIDTLSYSYGEYIIKATHFKRILSSTKSADPIIGDWMIDKLTNNYLSIYKTENGHEYFEFTKK